MKKTKLISYILSLLFFGLYSFIFFRNFIISSIISILISIKAHKIVQSMFRQKYLKQKRLMFREFLDIFNTNIISGSNIYTSLRNSSVEIKNIFNKDEYIVKYLNELILDLDNGLSIINSLKKFKSKCNINEVDIFVDSISIAVITGLDISNVTNISKDILTENISLEIEMSTIINNSKRDFFIMVILPLIILLLVNSTREASYSIVDYITRTGVFSLFIFSFYIGNKIVNMEI